MTRLIGSTLVVLCVALVPLAAQNKPVTFPVTLTAEQVAALQAEFGCEADGKSSRASTEPCENFDIPAKTQAWVNDWLVQFTRNLDEKEAREIIDSLKTAKPEDAAEVKKRLKLKVKK